MASLAGCGGLASTAPAAPDAHHELPGDSLADLVAAVGPHADFEILATPRALARVHDVAVEGRIASVEAGRTQMADFGDGVESVVFGIDVTEEYKSDPQRHGTLVYFELPRPDNVDAAVYRDRVGIGTRVILLGYHAPTMPPVENAFAGREPGSSLYQPSAQGLFIVSDDQPDGARTGAHGRAAATSAAEDNEVVPVMEGADALPPAWRDLSGAEIRGDLRAWQ